MDKHHRTATKLYHHGIQGKNTKSGTIECSILSKYSVACDIFSKKWCTFVLHDLKCKTAHTMCRSWWVEDKTWQTHHVVVPSVGRLLSKIEPRRRKERNAASHQMHQIPKEDASEKATGGTQFCQHEREIFIYRKEAVLVHPYARSNQLDATLRKGSNHRRLKYELPKTWGNEGNFLEYHQRMKERKRCMPKLLEWELKAITRRGLPRS